MPHALSYLIIKVGIWLDFWPSDRLFWHTLHLDTKCFTAWLQGIWPAKDRGDHLLPLWQWSWLVRELDRKRSGKGSARRHLMVFIEWDIPPMGIDLDPKIEVITVPCKVLFWGDIPWNLGLTYIGLIYRRYLQFLFGSFSSWPAGTNPSSTLNSPVGWLYRRTAHYPRPWRSIYWVDHELEPGRGLHPNELISFQTRPGLLRGHTS